jgi:putative serine protease PepD
MTAPRGPDFIAPDVPALPPPPLAPRAVPAPAGPAPAVEKRRRPLQTVAVAAATAVVLTSAVLLGTVGADRLGRDEPRTPAVALPSAGGDSPAGPVTDIARAVGPSVVQIDVRSRGRSGTGSGFVISDGLVLTNAHVVGSSRTVTVRTADDRRLSATVLGTDREADVAVLRLSAGTRLPALPVGDSRTLEAGDPVVAFGSPFGLSGTVTSGIVSAVDRPTSVGRAIQTDAAINPGNSGGPLVDAAGHVVGINTMIATSGGGGNIGIGFAVPIEVARQVAAEVSGPR